MFRSSFYVAILIAISSLHAKAQSTSELSPQMIWERFQSTCTQVLSDPDAFLSGLRRPGNFGERVISVSPDQKVVSVYNRISNAYEEIELHILGNRQLRDCSVIGEFYELDTSQLAQDFFGFVSLEQGKTISGGHAPQDYVEEGGIYTENDIYLYAIDGVWPEHGVLTIAHVIGGELQLYVQHSPN